MTHSMVRKRAVPVSVAAILIRPLPVTIVLGALALLGPLGSNVGSSWQCPLAQGGTCDSVAGADPAVPDAVSDPGAARKAVLDKPLYKVRDRTRADAPEPCRADCDGGFDPFGWLARLFGADRKETASPASKPAPERATTGAAEPPPPGFGDDPGAEPPVEPVIGTATLPAEPQPAGDDLRTEEVVARIWIAPFVDADGVYREGSHVRAVLAPAGWRVP